MNYDFLFVLSVLSPFFGFLGGIFLRNINKASHFFTILGMCIATFATMQIWVFTHGNIETYIPLYSWIKIGSLNLDIGILINPLTMVMLGVVNLISLLVHIYSLSYMSCDTSQGRFMAYLSLFTFMMLLLVTAPNMFQLFLGWEGVGLASYLLIGFWYEKPRAGSAAMKAFVVNRVGDLGLILAMGALFLAFDSLEFSTIFQKINTTTAPSLSLLGHSFSFYEMLGFFLLLAAMGKSAQFGLHVWLPDAMEGPTPVSALIHAATMVTAGIFLVAKFSFVYELTVYAKSALLWIGILTAFFAATVAVTQNDIKRIIAYSTCSQLGYMLAACGCGAYDASIFHLSTHAFFKALLFLGAGSVIHAMSGEQDIQKMGGIYKLIPLTYVFMWIGNLALAGIPYFAGYFSKDSILQALYLSSHPVAYSLGIVVVILTSFYSFRLLFLVFHTSSRAGDHVMAHVHESPFNMTFPLFILAIGAVISGFVGEKLFLLQKGFSWGHAIVFHFHEGHLPFIIHHLPTICSAFGIVLAYVFYIRSPSIPLRLSKMFLYSFSFHKWWVDELYQRLWINQALKLGNFFCRIGDKKLIDGLGPNGIAKISFSISRLNSYWQTGYVYHYALVMVLGILAINLFITFVFWR